MEIQQTSIAVQMSRKRGRSRSRCGSRVGREAYRIHRISDSHGERNTHTHDQTLKHTMREEDNQTDCQENLEEDMAKQVEKIRQRRQEILAKYKKLEQSEHMVPDIENSLGVENTKLGTSDLVGDTKLSLDKSFSMGFCRESGLLDRPSRIEQDTPKSEKDFIFGESPVGGQNQVRCDGLALETSRLSDDWDDADGYYCHRVGEVLEDCFEVAALHGRGVFSSVVRARALKPYTKNGMEVAIKIIRNNDLMLKCGQQEVNILKLLNEADPENNHHCVQFLTSLDYRNHLCLVFESLHMNLREALKKPELKTGFNFSAVRLYAKQLFIALKHLKSCGILHCDIKPDNILVNETKNVLKLCDFGSAMFKGENEIAPYLVSRFYRAPEIILGLRYDHPLDMWSVGCCLYEFFTGKVLFPGQTNNDMLRLHMQLKGPFPKKMLKKALFVSHHFDQDYNFCAVKENPVTKASIKHVLMTVKPKGIDSIVIGQGTSDENAKMLKNFKDLLDKIFILDPGKRLTVSQALNHPFITGL